MRPWHLLAVVVLAVVAVFGTLVWATWGDSIDCPTQVTP